MDKFYRNMALVLNILIAIAVFLVTYNGVKIMLAESITVKEATTFICLVIALFSACGLKVSNRVKESLIEGRDVKVEEITMIRFVRDCIESVIHNNLENELPGSNSQLVNKNYYKLCIDDTGEYPEILMEDVVTGKFTKLEEPYLICKDDTKPYFDLSEGDTLFILKGYEGDTFAKYMDYDEYND